MSHVKETPVSVVQQRLFCECGGEMKYDKRDGAFASNPPKYPHRCDACGDVENVSSTPYPRIVYIPQLNH